MAFADEIAGAARCGKHGLRRTEAIPAYLRRLVIRRAAERCEYCRLSQTGKEATFHLDHILPVAAGGATAANNLALACVSCSLRKGARQFAPDPFNGQIVPLYHPRLNNWSDHFRWDDVTLLGLTPTGRATVRALQMNRPSILIIRREEANVGRHPAPE